MQRLVAFYVHRLIIAVFRYESIVSYKYKLSQKANAEVHIQLITCNLQLKTSSLIKGMIQNDGLITFRTGRNDIHRYSNHLFQTFQIIFCILRQIIQTFSANG